MDNGRPIKRTALRRPRRRPRSGHLAGSALAAAAVATLAAAIRTSSSFQVPLRPSRCPWSRCNPDRSSSRASTLSAEVETRQYRDPSSLILRFDDEDVSNFASQPLLPPPSMTTTSAADVPSSVPSRSRVRKFKSINKTPLPRGGSGAGERATLSKQPSTRRSSTMPGFAGRSDRERAYREGIRIVDRSTGRLLNREESTEIRRQRRKENGDTLYRNSASVPDSLVHFADEIHREDRITRSEEIELGEKTQEALRLQTLYDSLEAKLDREPTDEEWCAAAGKINMESIRQAIDDGLEAKNKLVTSNLRMVQSVVNTYIRNGLSARYNAGDMMQEGIIALIRAAEKFEPGRGWKFSTYAMYWVRASVKRSQIHQSRIIPVPQRLYDTHKRLVRTQQELVHTLRRKPTNLELGQAVGMSEVQVERCLSAVNQKCMSLDQEISNAFKPNNGAREGSTLAEIVESRTEDEDHAHQKQKMLREALVETLHRHLEPDEVELLLLRFGLRSGDQLSIAKLSRVVGLKPDSVRRRIGTCLHRLRAIGVEEWLAFERELL